MHCPEVLALLQMCSSALTIRLWLKPKSWMLRFRVIRLEFPAYNPRMSLLEHMVLHSCAICHQSFQRRGGARFLTSSMGYLIPLCERTMKKLIVKEICMEGFEATDWCMARAVHWLSVIQSSNPHQGSTGKD